MIIKRQQSCEVVYPTLPYVPNTVCKVENSQVFTRTQGFQHKVSDLLTVNQVQVSQVMARLPQTFEGSVRHLLVALTQDIRQFISVQL